MSLTAFRSSTVAALTLALLLFAQAATAFMGCAALAADPRGTGVATMPSGALCDMLGQAPAPLALKHCLPGDAGVGVDGALPLPALSSTSCITVSTLAAMTLPATAHADTARILGPPPFRLTQRLRI